MANKKITDLQLRSSVTADLNIPGDDGIQSYRVTAEQMFNYIYGQTPQPDEISNIALSCSVGSNALTISLTNAAGTAPSASSPCRISFRNATLSNGTFTSVLATAATSLVISSGSTLGHRSTIQHNIYVYAVYTGSAIVLAASQRLFDEGELISTTAEGGAGAADSNAVAYSTAAQSSKPFRLIGRLRSTQTTAGTWAVVPTEISLNTESIRKSHVVAFEANTSTTVATTSAPFVFTNVVKDSMGCYDSSTGIFTAPESKYYFVAGTVYTGSASQALAIGKNGTYALQGICNDPNNSPGMVSHLFFLSAGDTIDIRPTSTVTATGGAGLNYFSVNSVG